MRAARSCANPSGDQAQTIEAERVLVAVGRDRALRGRLYLTPGRTPAPICDQRSALAVNPALTDFVATRADLAGIVAGIAARIAISLHL